MKRSRIALGVLAAGVAGATLAVGASPARVAGRATVLVSPNNWLRDAQSVSVRVSGFGDGVKVFLSECLAPQYSTLYAVPSPNWVLSRWTTTGLADTVDLAAGNPSITIAATTPSPLIAIFVPEGQTGTTTPTSTDDAGHD